MATGLQVSESALSAGMDSDLLKFYEVVDGQIVENPPMGAEESIVASFLQGFMDPFARSNRLGRAATETLFLLDRTRNIKRRPDLAFISDRRWPLARRVPRTEAWDVVPDLAVEFVSESNSANSVVIKVEEYFQAGVRRVWVAYPVVSKVYVYHSPAQVRILQRGDDLDGEDIIPGFRIGVTTLFAEGGEPVDDGVIADGTPDVGRGD
jgi:Uma2 family endonuclease